MKAAITEWQGRVAPVFDVAGTVMMIETETEALQDSMSLPPGTARNKIEFLKEQDVDVLICGAITRRMRAYAEEEGIQINPFISGEIDAVWDAWRNGKLDEACYSMPGCRHCRRRTG